MDALKSLYIRNICETGPAKGEKSKVKDSKREWRGVHRSFNIDEKCRSSDCIWTVQQRYLRCEVLEERLP